MVSTTVEKLSPTRVKMTISVTPEELKPSIDHAYQHIAEQVSIPGFRKGKVPPPIIDQRVGRGEVLSHAINEGLDSFYREAAIAEDVKPIGRPEADVVEIPDADTFQGDLKITVEVDVRPEIELPDYEGLVLTVDPVEVADADIDAELENLRTRFGTLVTVDRPAKSGDFVTLDLIATIAGETVDTASNVSYELGSGELIEGIDDALETLTGGESATFEAPLLGGDHEGETAQIDVTLLTVKERELPDADDEFAQIASQFDTIDELRADLKTQLGSQKTFEQASQARDKIVETLLEKVEIPVPPALVEDEVHRHLEQENRLDDDEHRAEVTEASEKSFRSQVLLDAITEKEQVQVSQDELTTYLVQSAAQYGMEPQEFVKLLDENGQIPGMIGEVARSKVLAILLGKAKVVDTAGAPVDVSAFVPKAADADAGSDDEAADADDEADADAAPAKKPAAKKAAAKKPAAKKAPKKADAAKADEAEVDSE